MKTRLKDVGAAFYCRPKWEPIEWLPYEKLL